MNRLGVTPYGLVETNHSNPWLWCGPPGCLYVERWPLLTPETCRDISSEVRWE